ncbi:hypothetical protein FGO68_gene12130 [Halteria grandinella]|uniref:Uncharacterized protein n=1 Tax=Halteria grandinella TaxID=5974 RepID=A0A8J8P476_HALGN|nr:hypothetical protein FGO68_gene12130 [Halteria grandinella]
MKELAFDNGQLVPVYKIIEIFIKAYAFTFNSRYIHSYPNISASQYGIHQSCINQQTNKRGIELKWTQKWKRSCNSCA